MAKSHSGKSKNPSGAGTSVLDGSEEDDHVTEVVGRGTDEAIFERH
jgi:hypothetical protein